MILNKNLIHPRRDESCFGFRSDCTVYAFCIFPEEEQISPISCPRTNLPRTIGPLDYRTLEFASPRSSTLHLELSGPRASDYQALRLSCSRTLELCGPLIRTNGPSWHRKFHLGHKSKRSRKTRSTRVKTLYNKTPFLNAGRHLKHRLANNTHL